MAYKHKNCLVSEKNGNKFSIYVDHYEDTQSERNVFIDPNAWENVFKSIYDVVAYNNFDGFKLVDNKLLQKADQETRRDHSFHIGLKKYDGVSDYMGSIKVNLVGIKLDKGRNRYSCPKIGDKEYYRMSKKGLEIMTDFAHNLAKDVAVNGTMADKYGLQEWMVAAKANYNRNSLSEIFGANQSLVDATHQAHEVRFPQKRASLSLGA